MEKLTLLTLAVMAAPDGTCFPRIRILAGHCNVSERTAQRTLRRLEAFGLVTVTKQWRKDGQQSSNLYRLAMDKPPIESTAGKVGTQRVTELCHPTPDAAMSPQQQHSKHIYKTQQTASEAIRPPLRFHESIPECERAAILAQLNGLPHQLCQELLDAVAEALSRPDGIRKTSVHYLVGVLNRYRAGTFTKRSSQKPEPTERRLIPTQGSREATMKGIAAALEALSCREEDD